MKIKSRTAIEIFNLSFLDVISCGFGAIILLLVISKISQPLFIKQEQLQLTNKIDQLEQQLNNETQQQNRLKNTLSSAEQLLVQLQNKAEKKQQLILTMQYQLNDSSRDLQAQKIIEQKMYQVRQSLTAEMRRLEQSKTAISNNNTVAGISVSSEYIIFIIDTSGSMKNFAWPLVRKKMQEILAIHPRVKGIQIINDMGDYMFSQYAGKWIKDTPARRRAILSRLISWEPFSNSSPEEGITRAIKQFYASDKAISLYVLGDDFSRGSIQSLLDTVDRLNKKSRSAQKRVRINAIGFPVLFQHPDGETNIVRFAALMRKLAENNNGSFVGLTHLK